MDTRTKIINGDAASALIGQAVFVSGYFDPLLAAHATRLNALAERDGPVVVLLLDPPDPLLPAGARAELLAALAAVRSVVGPPGSQALIPALDGELIRFEEEDAAITRALIEHLHRRHS